MFSQWLHSGATLAHQTSNLEAVARTCFVLFFVPHWRLGVIGGIRRDPLLDGHPTAKIREGGAGIRSEGIVAYDFILGSGGIDVDGRIIEEAGVDGLDGMEPGRWSVEGFPDVGDAEA